MISNLTRYGTRAAFPPCHFLLRQNLHSGIVLRVPSSSDAVTVKKKRAGTRTKKLFSELPAVQLKADGSPVTPLAPWTGGLEDLAPVTVVEIVDIGGNAEPTPPDPSVTPKRTRKRKTTKSVQENEGTDTAAPLDTQDAPTATPKPKRTRKAKVANKPTKLADEDVPQEGKSPLAVEILGNLAKFPHCLLLTRVGQFYESYFDQAAEMARLLNIKLTSKSWGGKRVLMCGFPLMHLDKYLKVLVQQNKRFVAICEEFMRDRTLGPKGGFDRRVTRIVTPGTLIDEPFLNAYENNYLISIAPENVSGESPEDGVTKFGLAWIDVSTGDFFTKSTCLDELRDELVRIGPKEVVLDRRLQDSAQHPIRHVLAEEGLLISYAEVVDPVDANATGIQAPTSDVGDDLTLVSGTPIAEELMQPLSASESKAVELLAAYMHANLLEHMPRLTSPNREVDSGRMQIDAHTLRALEIRESMREGGVSGTLFSVVKRTVTTSGTRLLARWLCSPSTSITEINTRQSLVAFLKKRTHLRADLVQSLGSVEDATRIVQKFLAGRGDTNDLLAVRNTIDVWESIRSRMQMERDTELQGSSAALGDEWNSPNMLMEGMCDLRPLADSINLALVKGDAPLIPAETQFNGVGTDLTDVTEADVDRVLSSTVTGEWAVRPGFSEHLTLLHATLRDLLSRKDNLERLFQSSYDAPSLTLRSSPAQGMHVHIGRVKRDSTKLRSTPSFILIAESGSTCCFFNQEWSQLGSNILETTIAINVAEREAFETLRNEVTAKANDLRRNARILDELDVTLSFANLAEEMNFCRPNLREDTSYHVVNGRHPTVELGLLTAGRTFTPNTVSFTLGEPLHIITGPNMAGKSTLLRQTALIAVLAQTGSFVPADNAEMGIIDRVFSRVGAKDDLFHDRSTFMVEMLETAEILRRATPQSLVIMDEVGRGTTVNDGLAIAFATVHHLLTVNRCRALFATHFHELADMLGYSENHRGHGVFSGISFFCTDIDELQDGYFSYSHHLKPGVNRDSHGLKVAQLAGMPESALAIATSAMSQLRIMDIGNGKQDFHAIGQVLAG